MMKLKSILRRTTIYKLYRSFRSRPIINVNKKKSGKRALLSYSTALIKSLKKEIHPNHIEIALINKILDQMGYMVDVYNNTDGRRIDYSNYDLIIGEGLPISNYFIGRQFERCQVKTIYYATGSYPLFQNTATYRRIFDFYHRRGKYLPESGRAIDERWAVGASLSDYVILIGNETTKRTFEEYRPSENIFTLNPPVYEIPTIQTDCLKKPNKFLWFGSYGLLHKGLDIVLETFLARPDVELEVCGFLENESNLLDIYHEDLEKASNIHFHGFISIYSEEFNKLVSECSYVILLSGSEGVATGVASCMAAGGLIPVVNKNCGIDTALGIEIEGFSISDVDAAVNKAVSNPLSSIIAESERIRKYAQETFSQEVFENALRAFLCERI